jgi:hypothetical protein
VGFSEPPFEGVELPATPCAIDCADPPRRSRDLFSE